MTVLDLRGRAAGDPAGLAALAAALRGAARELARASGREADAVLARDAADACEEAAAALRSPGADGAAVELRLAGALRALLGAAAG